jgi:hypothetical protein
MYLVIAPDQLCDKYMNYLPQKRGVYFVFSPQEMKFERCSSGRWHHWLQRLALGNVAISLKHVRAPYSLQRVHNILLIQGKVN